MGKNKLYQSKQPCSECNQPVIYNETHHWVFCMCKAPQKTEIPQWRLDRDFVKIAKIPMNSTTS